MAVLAGPIQTTFTGPRQLQRGPTRMESTLQTGKVSAGLRAGSSAGGEWLMETAGIAGARRVWMAVTHAARPGMPAVAVLTETQEAIPRTRVVAVAVTAEPVVLVAIRGM